MSRTTQVFNPHTNSIQVFTYKLYVQSTMGVFQELYALWYQEITGSRSSASLPGPKIPTAVSFPLTSRAEKASAAAGASDLPGRPASSQVVQRVGPSGREPLVVLQPPADGAVLPEPPRAVGGGDSALLGPPPVPPRPSIRPAARRTSGGGSSSSSRRSSRVADGCAAPDRVVVVGRSRRRRQGVAGEEERGRPERERDQREQQQELDAPGGAHI
ncbi:unnamed protein product [Urochloa humidicola]